MKKYTLMVLSILLINAVAAQSSFIKKLPMRGEPAKMIATTDGGYACLAATDYVNFQFNKISLIKCDANGDTVWTQKYSLNDSSVYFPKSLIEIQNVGFAIVSVFSLYPFTNYGNGVVFFVDMNGNELWNEIFFNSGSTSTYNFFDQLLPISVNSISVLGGLFPYKNLYTMDFFGNVTNVNTTDTFTYAFSNLNLDTNNNPIFSRVLPPNIYNRQNIFKSDPFYTHITDKNYNNVKGKFANVNKLDNGLAYLSTGGDTIIKLDSNLDSLWTHSVTNYYAPGFLSQLPTDFKATADGGYVMCGNISNSIAHLVFLLKTDSLANSQFRQVYFGAAVDNVVSVEQATDGGYVMFQSGNPDTTNVPEMWLVKTDSTGLLTHVKNEAVKQQGVDFKLSPNPATENVRVAFTKNATGKIMMLDLAGRVLYAANVKNKTTVNIPVAKFKNGLYAVLFTSTSSKPSVKKLIVNH